MLKSTLAVLAALCCVALPRSQSAPCLSAFDNPNYLVGTSMGGPNLLLGIKARNGASAVLLFGGEVFTGNVPGLNSLAIWTHDAANNRPGTQLGIANWNGPSSVGWQGANFAAPIALAAGQDFWLVWGPQNGAQISAERFNSTTGQQYRGSFDGGQSWNGPFVNYDWKYRLWCNPVGSFSIFGTSCAGSGRTRPTISASGTPSIGQGITISLSNALANAPARLFLGLSDQFTGGVVPLPYDLTPFGAPGCMIWVDLLAEAAMSTDGVGAASLNLTVPNVPALIGAEFFGQWMVIDAAANAMHLVTSNAVEILIGA